MSTLRFNCVNRVAMESLIADIQEVYSHVEFISWTGTILTIAYIA